MLNSRPWYRSIQIQMGARLLAIITGILALFGLYQYWETRSNSLQELNDLAVVMKARLGESLIIPLWNMNFQLIEKTILSEMQDKHVSAIIVKEVANDRVLKGMARDPHWAVMEVTDDVTGAFLAYPQEIRKEGEKLGTVTIYLTLQFMRARLRTNVYKTILTILVLDAVLIVMVSLIVRKMLIHPLACLLTNARAIAAGDFSQAMRSRQQDEIGALTDAFGEMQTKIACVLEDLRILSQSVREGILGTRGTVEAVTGGWRELVIGINQVLDAFAAPMAHINQTLARIARGDLTGTLHAEYQGDFQTMMQQVQMMTAKLTSVVMNVKFAAQDVTQRSRELKTVAEQLSEGTSQQAAATEEVSASMQEMAANIRQTAENARLTESMAVTSAADARAGKQAVTEIIQAMEVIAERISMIQEIAGQTNMLSLNATIEAAKAQDYGKGFTVVASSVRELARQSRTAADEIRTLVHSCVALSAHAGEVLQRLVPNSEKTAELVQEINAAAQEQSTGVEHVNQAVQQLDLVTQHNAATAEQVSGTAETLTVQAEALQETMAFFTVNADAQATMIEDEQWQQFLHVLTNAPNYMRQQMLTFFEAALPNEASATHGRVMPLKSSENKTQPLPQKPKPAAYSAPVKNPAIHLDTPHTAADERDQEFEHY